MNKIKLEIIRSSHGYQLSSELLDKEGIVPIIEKRFKTKDLCLRKVVSTLRSRHSCSVVAPFLNIDDFIPYFKVAVNLGVDVDVTQVNDRSKDNYANREIFHGEDYISV